MESKLFQLINHIEENRLDISASAYNSIVELIEEGETSVTKDTAFGISDWGGEVRSIFSKFGIRVYSGYNLGKFLKIKTPGFLNECDYYLLEKEMGQFINEINKLPVEKLFNNSTLIKINSEHFTIKFYIKNTETLELDWLEIFRNMPDRSRKLTDQKKINSIIKNN